MSGYTAEIRKEILSRLPTASCCRRSMLAGLLINAEPGRDGAVYIRLTGREVFSLASDLLASLYGREPEAEEKNCYGRSVFEAVTQSRPLSELISSLADPAHISEPPSFFSCRACRTYFTAGLMLSSVTLSDPSVSSRAELRVNDPAVTSKLSEFFLSEGIFPSVSYRKGTGSLLFKRSDDVESLLGLCGAKVSAMDSMQKKLLREFKGDINRRANCEVANIAKATSTAGRQKAAIEALKAAGRFYSLPDDLRESAELRLSHPEKSLSELAAMHMPPISKSGLNHRMARISALAEEEPDYPRGRETSDEAGRGGCAGKEFEE
ncbi:MAG: DNA-binding protein WhiA [Clostridia bacterium]|nr:DNA-binding protein WhiA [Clostridia bacterium]